MYNKNPMGLFTEFMRRYFAAMGQTTASQVDPEAWRQMAEDMARKLTEAVDTQASERTPPSPHANEAGAQADDPLLRDTYRLGLQLQQAWLTSLMRASMDMSHSARRYTDQVARSQAPDDTPLTEAQRVDAMAEYFRELGDIVEREARAFNAHVKQATWSVVDEYREAEATPMRRARAKG